MIVDTWRNVPGAEIPDWIQGRGFGTSGGVLHLYLRDGLARVEPGDWLVCGSDREPYFGIWPE